MSLKNVTLKQYWGAGGLCPPAATGAGEVAAGGFTSFLPVVTVAATPSSVLTSFFFLFLFLFFLGGLVGSTLSLLPFCVPPLLGCFPLMVASVSLTLDQWARPMVMQFMIPNVSSLAMAWSHCSWIFSDNLTWWGLLATKSVSQINTPASCMVMSAQLDSCKSLIRASL